MHDPQRLQSSHKNTVEDQKQTKFSVEVACVFSGFRPQNLIAQSQSGTGKTAAFCLAMLSHVSRANKWPQVSVMTMRTSSGSSIQLEELKYTHQYKRLGSFSASASRQHTSSLCRSVRSSRTWGSIVLMSNWCMPFVVEEVSMWS